MYGNQHASRGPKILAPCMAQGPCDRLAARDARLSTINMQEWEYKGCKSKLSKSFPTLPKSLNCQTSILPDFALSLHSGNSKHNS